MFEREIVDFERKLVLEGFGTPFISSVVVLTRLTSSNYHVAIVVGGVGSFRTDFGSLFESKFGDRII